MTDFDEFDAFDGVPLSQRAMAARPAPYLDELNAAQRAAVEALDGPVLMLAGAGTGKTKALTTRIVHLLNTHRAGPHEILSVTFTNKAAREMKDRVARMLGQSVEGMPWLGTFHSICVKLLRRHAELVTLDLALGRPEDDPLMLARQTDVLEDVLDESDPVGFTPNSNEVFADTGYSELGGSLKFGEQKLSTSKSTSPGLDQQGTAPIDTPQGVLNHLKSNFTILDTDDQNRLLKQLIEAAGIDHKRWPARQLSGVIDHWKNRAWTPEQVPTSEAAAFNNRGIELYKQYQRRLVELNACDFGDLLMHVVSIFQRYPDLLETYRNRFKYILVDEYQDTNVAQYLWLRLLAGGHKNICCVGDDDQSIYGWRGAEVGNILRFEADFPGAEVIRLEQNYRSTPHILAAASGVIQGNSDRLGKTLWTDRDDGEKVRLIGHWDGEEEARWIGEEIESAQRGTRGMKPYGLDSMAILVRASHQMRAFEDRFLTIGLPYRVIGGPRFYERMEIRDAMAYFRVVTSPADDLAFERIVNTPKRGLGDKAQQKIQMTARQHGVPLVEGARILLQDKGIGGKGAKELALLVDNIARWGRLAGGEDLSHIELAEMILDESGYTTMWQNDKTPEAPGRLENLKELVKALEQFENLSGFLEHVALIMDNDSEDAEQKVSIMTLHAAKGLEFPVVFLPGWEDGLFPSQRSMDDTGLKGLEEERRLAYVGITRAEELCTISFASNRRVYGQWQAQMTSRFIDELPPEHVKVLTGSGDAGGGYGASSIDQRVADANVYNSPGWKRMQARSQQRPLSQPKESRNTIIDLEAVSAYTIGDRVFHQKFGYGSVTAIEGDKLDVDFEKAGPKKVVAKFVTGAGEVPF